jgi:membrane associated rhomboid family serine protease
MDSRRMCPHCRAFITTSDRVCPYCHEQVAPRRVERGPASGMFAGVIPHARFNTVLILLINLGLYFATSIYSMKSGRGSAMNIDVRTLFDFGAKFGPAIGAGQWWRLVTAGFLHGGMVHILMNSWVLFDLGAAVEEIYGASRMLVIYFISTVAGFYLSALWNPQVPSVGASAALFGMVGAMLALGVRHRNPLGDAIRGVYMRYVIYMLLFSLLPGIDMAAHIGGLIGGFGTAYLAGMERYTDSPAETIWRIASWLCILITGVSFLKMYLWLTGLSQ